MFINCWKGVIMKLSTIIDVYVHEDVMIAFSGGVDSTLLLKMAVEASQKYHTRVYAVTIQTALHPVMEADEAKRMAEETGAIHKVIHVDELEGAGIENNPVDRCYLCKKYMFTQVRELAHSLGVSTILEGTNADDLKQYRPGIKAIQELGLHSPLLEANMTKKEIRELAGTYDLKAANKPSSPCLATRFPYHTLLNYEEMRKVEKIEDYLHACGFYNVRARIHNDLVRLEIDQDTFMKCMDKRQEIVLFIKELGYDYVTLDLEGFRSGSQDIKLEEK